jgi:hypothetical protein
MARPFKVDLATEAERKALGEMAIREYRDPDDQAAFLVREGLRQAGYLERLLESAPHPSGERAS